MRKKFFLHVYMVGVYADKATAERVALKLKQSAQSEVNLADALYEETKRSSVTVLLRFYRNVSNEQFINAIVQAFEGVPAEATASFRAYLQEVVGDGLSKDDVLEISWLKGGGLSMAKNQAKGLCFPKKDEVERRLMQVYLDPARTVSQEVVQTTLANLKK